jgi:IclR family transcriptional regulator, acetate operon repressor
MGTPKNHSVMKAFALLRSFRPDEWLTCSELARRGKMPEASAYRLIQTLVDLGAAVRDGRGRYRPGMLLLELSDTIDRRDLWRASATQVFDRWTKRLGVTVQLGIFEEGMVTYVARTSQPRDNLLPQQGTQFEAYCTALGKVLLSELPEADLRAFFADGDLIAFTPQTITSEPLLRRELEMIRQRGTAFDDRETLENVRCVAAPVRNQAGAIVAALSLCGAAEVFSEESLPALTDAVRDAAAELAASAFPWLAAA